MNRCGRPSSQSPIVNEYDTTRVPGFMASNVGRSRRFTVGQQIQRHDGSVAEVGLEDVALHERDARFNALGRGETLRMLHEIRVVLDADRRCAEVLAAAMAILPSPRRGRRPCRPA